MKTRNSIKHLLGASLAFTILLMAGAANATMTCSQYCNAARCVDHATCNPPAPDQKPQGCTCQ
jgi:hypothetical protein